MMAVLMNESPAPHFLIHIVLDAVKEYANHNCPSPTIQQLAQLVGHSEEAILESLEFGQVEPVSIIQ